MNSKQRTGKIIDKIVALANKSEISSIRNVVTGILKIIDDPNSTAKDLKEIIEIDPPLTAKLLRLANSAFYSPRNEIHEIQQAIIWVGYDAIKELALSQKVCGIFQNDTPLGDYSRISLWRHSVEVALLSKMISRREFGDRGDSVYAAGLLHDIGIIIEDQFLHDRFKEILDKASREEKNVPESEHESFGFNHTVVGKSLVDNWGIPKELAAAIGNHHNPEKVQENFAKITHTVYIADTYCQENGSGYKDAPYKDNSLYRRSLDKMKIQELALNLMFEEVKKEISEMDKQGIF